MYALIFASRVHACELTHAIKMETLAVSACNPRCNRALEQHRGMHSNTGANDNVCIDSTIPILTTTVDCTAESEYNVVQCVTARMLSVE